MEFNVGEVFSSIAGNVADRPCIVHRHNVWTYRAVDERSNALAAFLVARGLGEVAAEREDLEQWESGQDHLGLLAFNSVEYMEGMLACFKARIAPFNLNYRYTAEELEQILIDARPRALLFQSSFADRVAEVLGRLPVDIQVLIQVDDGTAADRIEDAVWYADVVSDSSANGGAVRDDLNGDDLNILYTGGTTGMPKGVLWRQADAFVSSYAGRHRDGTEYESVKEVVDRARRGARSMLPAQPFMHGGGQITVFQKWMRGATVVLPSMTNHLDAEDLLETIDEYQVAELGIVGDAFAVPLIRELERSPGRYGLEHLRAVYSGGARLSVANREAMLHLLPGVKIVDAIGSSESGPMAALSTVGESEPRELSADPIGFEAGDDTVVLSEDLTRKLRPGDAEIGWLARRGRIALGYLNDPEKTRRTYPTIDGSRHVILGDRARILPSGRIEFLGRSESVINTGGEKVFAHEVEAVIESHPSVAEAVVLGRPHPRWGQEVCALVKIIEQGELTELELQGHCREQLSGYKIPRAYRMVPFIRHTAAGKVDYSWARSELSQLNGASETEDED